MEFKLTIVKYFISLIIIVHLKYLNYFLLNGAKGFRTPKVIPKFCLKIYTNLLLYALHRRIVLNQNHKNKYVPVNI